MIMEYLKYVAFVIAVMGGCAIFISIAVGASLFVHTKIRELSTNQATALMFFIALIIEFPILMVILNRLGETS